MHDAVGLCGFLYHGAFPFIDTLQFGGTFPWGGPDAIELACTDRANAVKMELRRIGEN